jgi:hypothetical protein
MANFVPKAAFCAIKSAYALVKDHENFAATVERCRATEQLYSEAALALATQRSEHGCWFPSVVCLGRLPILEPSHCRDARTIFSTEHVKEGSQLPRQLAKAFLEQLEREHGHVLIHVCCQCDSNHALDSNALILVNEICVSHGLSWHRLMMKRADGSVILAIPLDKDRTIWISDQRSHRRWTLRILVAVVAPINTHSAGLVGGPLLGMKYAAAFNVRLRGLFARFAVQIAFFVPVVFWIFENLHGPEPL